MNSSVILHRKGYHLTHSAKSITSPPTSPRITWHYHHLYFRRSRRMIPTATTTLEKCIVLHIVAMEVRAQAGWPCLAIPSYTERRGQSGLHRGSTTHTRGKTTAHVGAPGQLLHIPTQTTQERTGGNRNHLLYNRRG